MDLNFLEIICPSKQVSSVMLSYSTRSTRDVYTQTHTRTRVLSRNWSGHVEASEHCCPLQLNSYKLHQARQEQEWGKGFIISTMSQSVCVCVRPSYRHRHRGHPLPTLPCRHLLQQSFDAVCLPSAPGLWLHTAAAARRHVVA